MKRTITLFVLLILTIAASADTAEILRAETTKNLRENLLPFWIEKTVDPQGGFYGVVLNNGKAIEHAPKGAVLNARITWTFSRAYRQDGLEVYKQMADRAADYYIRHFIDPIYGGVYWQLDSEGHPKETTKQTYACAFGIYGLAEHFRATGDRRSLETALKLYKTLEEKVHDKAELGYIESFQRDYSKAPLKGVDGQANATKTMNTHIHVLEAYTTLYQVWPDEGLKNNLIELLGILQTKLYDPHTNHLILYADYLITGMIIPGSQYWNQTHGNTVEEVVQDKERHSGTILSASQPRPLPKNNPTLRGSRQKNLLTSFIT